MSQIRVLCVEDHRLIREGIVHILDLEPDIAVVAQAETGSQAVEEFLKHRPHVTLMDLRLPGTSGLEAIRTIRDTSPDAKIIVLTMYQSDEDIYRAFRAGAAGYLLKETLPQQLIHAIREVHAGRSLVSEDIRTKLDQHAAHPPLTKRESEVLQLLAKGLRNKEIAGQLQMSEDTARAHIRGIFLKLQVHDRTAALAEALRRGLIQIE
jgi:DNA-binding NarL/FixJ family response regulator